MSKVISGSIIAHKLLSNNVEIDDQVSCQLPSIEKPTQEIKGAGIMGPIDMPMTGQVNSMVFSISSRSINSGASELAKPGVQNLELRFIRDIMQADGSMIPEGTKIFISGVNKKYDPGKIENGATMDGSIEFEVLRYRQVINGKEVLLIDKLNSIYKINGIDYMEKIRAAL
ncbi:phage major tail tube protein [Niameybacter massiliensis]|uniref:Phage major tail tube protein n=1 Tax=Holtiella tumoricola TaxID=3018743 RepID=A0AA42DNY8_9FIRM|nr:MULTISPECIES: phage major tail tube protein [Lachnospirales]MDA3732387.1 phage major tail tube protein [Holtiella tumoricola]